MCIRDSSSTRKSRFVSSSARNLSTKNWIQPIYEKGQIGGYVCLQKKLHFPSKMTFGSSSGQIYMIMDFFPTQCQEKDFHLLHIDLCWANILMVLLHKADCNIAFWVMGLEPNLSGKLGEKSSRSTKQCSLCLWNLQEILCQTINTFNLN